MKKKSSQKKAKAPVHRAIKGKKKQKAKVSKNILSMGVSTLVLAVIVIAGLFVADPVVEYEFAVGDIATETIAATRDIEDVYTTNLRIEEARNSIQDVYKTDLTISDAVSQNVNEMITAYTTVRNAAKEYLSGWIEEQVSEIPVPVAPPENGGSVGSNQIVYSNETELTAAREAYYQQINDLNSITLQEALSEYDVYPDSFWEDISALVNHIFTTDQLRAIILLSDTDISVVTERVPEIVQQLMNAGVREESFEDSKTELMERFRTLGVSDAMLSVLESTVVEQIQVNVYYDEEATTAAKDAAEAAVEHIIYKKGQTIIQSGQPITQAQYDMVDALGLLKSGSGNYTNYISMSIVILFVCFVQMYVLYMYKSQMFSELRNNIAFCLILMISVFSYALLKQVNAYICTSLLAVILLSLILDSRVGLISGISLSLFMGMYNGGNFAVCLTSLLACTICASAIKKASLRRASIILVSLAGGLGAVIITTAMNYYLTAKFDNMWTNVGWIMASAFLSAVISIGFLPVLEYMFKIVTPIRLLELSNPNQPILKRLMLEAPGTYYHSIVVGNMAETAANAVDADGTLARIGAYYHDIGKLMRPYMFKENQTDDINPHDELPPEISAKIIISHVKDGLYLAKEYKVPEILHQFIEEHHGNTLASFFYYNACELYGKENVNEADYRYSGKTPSTKECAIVMLADTVEAAVRSMKSHEANEVKAMITKLVDAKIDGRQLDNCPLTLKEITIIKENFFTVLSGAYHERVAYPQYKLEEGKNS